MKRRWLGAAVIALGVAACERDGVGLEVSSPPRAVDASYYAGSVTVSWELASDWDGETFRVYGKRSTDASYYLVAEVTSCAAGVCF